MGGEGTFPVTRAGSDGRRYSRNAPRGSLPPTAAPRSSGFEGEEEIEVLQRGLVW